MVKFNAKVHRLEDDRIYRRDSIFNSSGISTLDTIRVFIGLPSHHSSPTYPKLLRLEVLNDQMPKSNDTIMAKILPDNYKNSIDIGATYKIKATHKCSDSVLMHPELIKEIESRREKNLGEKRCMYLIKSYRKCRSSGLSVATQPPHRHAAHSTAYCSKYFPRLSLQQSAFVSKSLSPCV